MSTPNIVLWLWGASGNSESFELPSSLLEIIGKCFSTMNEDDFIVPYNVVVFVNRFLVSDPFVQISGIGGYEQIQRTNKLPRTLGQWRN